MHSFKELIETNLEALICFLEGEPNQKVKGLCPFPHETITKKSSSGNKSFIGYF